MTKKIQYRALDVQHLSVESVLDACGDTPRIVVGVDVAKRKFLAAICAAEGEMRLVVRFEHPAQTQLFVNLLEGMSKAGRSIEVAMEPTGTYGDPLRYQLGRRELPVFRVNNKSVHDAAELFDRSPSKHDAKDACLIAWLHVHQRSTRWVELSAARRSIRALVAQRELYDEPLRRLISQVEPLVARHFPELESFFELSRRKAPYRLLEEFRSPAGLVQAGAERLTGFLKNIMRKSPAPEFVNDLLNAARNTSGQVAVEHELELLSKMASEVLRLMRMREEVDVRIERAGVEIRSVGAMRCCLGAVTAAIIYAYLGDPTEYQSAAAFEKAAGLNLVERSSGTDAGTKHISKRGPGIVRKYLFLAAMRLTQTSPIAKAWYQSRKSFGADQKAKALIALERKLCRALFHVAADKPFDATKLFDTRRLDVAAVSCTEAA
jgi:transposase